MFAPIDLEAGPGQQLVVYATDDTGNPIDIGEIWPFVAEDAARRAKEGWRIVAMTVTPMRQTGTAGNMLFQTGGQYATQVAVTVAYAQG